MSTLLKEHKLNFTQAEYEQTIAVNILDYLQRNGYQVEKSGREFFHLHWKVKIMPYIFLKPCYVKLHITVAF